MVLPRSLPGTKEPKFMTVVSTSITFLTSVSRGETSISGLLSYRSDHNRTLSSFLTVSSSQSSSSGDDSFSSVEGGLLSRESSKTLNIFYWMSSRLWGWSCWLSMKCFTYFSSSVKNFVTEVFTTHSSYWAAEYEDKSSYASLREFSLKGWN